MYNSLRVALLERVRDKEPFVRVQAVAALAKMYGSKDLEKLGEGEQTATEVLEDLLAHDPSVCVSRLPHLYPLALPNRLLSDVRLAALLNIPIAVQTPVDMTVRRLVYGSVLLAHADLPDDARPDLHTLVRLRSLNVSRLFTTDSVIVSQLCARLRVSSLVHGSMRSV